MGFSRKLLVPLTALMSVGLVGINAFSATNPTAAEIENLLGRKLGQTEFANPSSYGGNRGQLESVPFAASAPTAGRAVSDNKRAIQESDVFKIGKPGSKLLYLLNNYRGLQIVSYEDGADKPKLVSRVEATGNSPADMYYFADSNRLVVLENVYFDESGKSKYYSENQGRVVVYDVADINKPTVSQTIDFKGSVSDSRLVGDVLYVGSSIRPNWYDQNASQSSKGIVQSFNVSGSEVVKLHDYEMSLPLASEGKMNIIEQEVANGYKYYLVAVLQNTNWWFWETQSQVEVVDISNPQGDIKPIMKVAARGRVSERSQTLIKDDYLVVVSNFFVEEDRKNIGMVAVESFAFPTENPDVLKESEAKFRQMWMARELENANLKDPKQIDAKKKELLENPELGLAGKFVKADKTLTKPYADSSASARDTTGLSASLRDVRVNGDMLYVFWVPVNQIDPFDLFDISDLSKGVKRIARLQIEGWIERAVPFNLNGRNFVLGLGWIVPADNNERGVRKAQATLFEIVDDEGEKTPKELTQLILSEEGAWSAGFQQQDKYLDIRDNGDGTGSLLFSQYAKVGQSWSEGGKLVYFDFNQVFAKNKKGFFKEGGFLVGSNSWLKRVFTNTEINRINTFSDENLATYQDDATLKEGAIVRAANVLELARNIVAYEIVKTANTTFGMQVISNGSYYSGTSTEVRIVNTPDQERKDAALMTLTGGYVTHTKVSASSILVYTSSTKYPEYKPNQKQEEPVTTHRVFLVSVVDGGKVKRVDANIWTSKGYSGGPSFGFGGRRGMPWMRSSTGEFVALQGGNYLLNGISALMVFTPTQDSIVTREYSYENCPELVTTSEQTQKPYVSEVQPQAVGGKLYMLSKVTAKIEKTDLAYTQNYLSPISFAAQKAVCGTAVNIPGEPYALDGDNLVTRDTQVLDIATYQRPDWSDKTKMRTISQFITSEGLTSVKLAAQTATLEDLTQAVNDTVIYDLAKIGKAEFMYVKSPVQDNYSWRSSRDYEAMHEVNFVTVENFKFKNTVRGLQLSTSQPQSVLKVATVGNNQIALLSSGNAVRAIKWDKATKRVALVPVTTGKDAAEVAYVPTYLWGENRATYDADAKAFYLSLGYTGVKAVQLK